MRKRKSRSKLISLVMAIGLILQFSNFVAAFAAVPEDLTGASDYLVVHSTSGSYAGFGGPSSLTVRRADNTVITPTGNTYSNVPAGATLTLDYVFHLNDGDGESEIYSYSGANYFTIALPDGITFAAPVGVQANIYATDTESGETWLLGTWSFDDSHTVRVDFDAAVADHLGRWAKIGITGTFDALAVGDETSTSLILGTQEITFAREVPPPPEIALAKEGVYDAALNEITWTVTVTPPEGVDLDGYSLVDTYSANQTFKSGSFHIGEINVLDAGLDLSAANTVRYTFPEDTIGAQTITYKTTPDTFSYETGAQDHEFSTFANTASVYAGSEEITEPADAEVAPDWIAKSGENVAAGSDVIIRWTVSVTVPEGGAITGASVTDLIPAGLQLLNNPTYPVQVTVGGTAANVASGSDSGTYTYAYTDSDTASTLTYRFPEGQLTGAAALVYYTQVTERQKYLNSNAPVTFRNSAGLSWTEMPDALNPPRDTASVGVVGSGGLLSKSGGSTTDYAYPGYIHWTITVNRNDISIPGASVADTIPAGQRLLIDDDHPFTVKHEGTQQFQTKTPAATPEFTSTDAFVNDFSYSLGTIADTYTIDYYTQIIDTDTGSTGDISGLDTLYVNSDSVSFRNDATLSRTGDVSISTPGWKTYKSQIIDKTDIGGYDYGAHTVRWQIVVNRNLLPLANASVSDTLPPGMVLLIDAEHPFTVTQSGVTEPVATAPTTGENGGAAFTYDFAEKIGAQYTITFYTYLTDAALLSQWPGTRPFANSATLSANELSDDIEVTSTVWIANPVVTKDYDYDTGSDHIDWSAVVNAGQIPLSGASVVDKLDAGLQLDLDSVKLYQVGVASSGTVAAASEGTLVTEGYSVDPPTAENDNTLTVTLPDTRFAYRLEFTTYILSDDLDFTNAISLNGSVGSPGGQAESTNLVINDLWSSGGSGSRKLTVHKEDGEGNPVAGAGYQLLNFNMQPVTKGGSPVRATTNGSGDAVFTNLPAWVFYAQEVSTPDGYLLNTTPFGGERLTGDLTLNTQDRPAVGNVAFAKTTESGRPLSGGEFTLTGTDYDNNPVTRTAESDGGTVTFKDVPLGSYTITETEAPAGYYGTEIVITASVAYYDDRTGVAVTVAPDTLINEAIPGEEPAQSYGTISLKKTDEAGAPLGGAEFGLYNASGTLVKTAASQDDGTVLFYNVVFGAYTIREIKAPEGYELTAVEAAAVTAQSKPNVRAKPDTIVNYKTEEPAPGTPATSASSIRITKIDAATKAVLAGAEFTLYDGAGTALQTAVSGADGVALFSGLEAGAYAVRETAAPEGYAADKNEIAVTLEPDSAYAFTVENDQAVGGISDDELPAGPAGGALPQTGGFWDAATLGMLGAALILLGLIMLAKKGKRQKN